MGDKILRIYPQLHRMLYTPQSMFDYTMVLARPLVHARQLDALGIEVGVDIVRIRRGVLTVSFREPRIYIPAGEVGIDEEVYGRYKPVIVNILTTLSNDLKRAHDLFNKAMDTGASEAELNSLGYFFGDLQGEVASFLRRIDKTKPAQWEGLVGKYLTIAFQRLATKAVQRLAEEGAVLRDTAEPSMLRLLWFPNTSGGVYDIPSGKTQVLALLRQVLPGLIDYNTGESEYTRLARLALRLNDDYDIDTLIDIITRLYPSLGSAGRPLDGMPRKYTPLVLLSFALSMETRALSFIDFEGSTPIVITYPKILIQDSAP